MKGDEFIREKKDGNETRRKLKKKMTRKKKTLPGKLKSKRKKSLS